MEDFGRYKHHQGWKAYKSVKPNSGIVRYALGDDFILIVFKGSDSAYIYNYQVTGTSEVEEMKGLAIRGEGLSSFISKHVHDKFAGDRPLDFFNH